MAKGFTGIEVKEYEPIPDGSYQVNGIDEFLPNSLGVDGSPCFTMIKDELKVCVKLTTTTGTEGPAISLTPAEYIALVHAFGGNTFAPTKQNRVTSASLLEGKSLASGKNFSVMVKNGWAKKSANITLPAGGYTVTFKEAHRPDWKGLEWHENTGMDGNINQFLIFDFEVTADREGNPSLWEGFVVSLFMGNPFVDMKEANGQIYSAMELEHPLLIANANGRRWNKFMEYFAPEMLETYEWKIDPAQSIDGQCEVLKPHYPIIRQAKSNKHPIKIYWEAKQRGKGMWFNLESLPQMNPVAPVAKPPAEAVAPTSMHMSDGTNPPSSWSDDATAALPEIVITATPQEFVDYVKSNVWGDYVVDEIFETESPVVLTVIGIDWAKEYLGGDFGPWKAVNLPTDNRFDSLSNVGWYALITEMKSRYANS